jgi:hypothetical protein
MRTNLDEKRGTGDGRLGGNTRFVLAHPTSRKQFRANLFGLLSRKIGTIDLN